jgi:phosphoenolpyruvate carboxykinase (GTP)
VRRDPMAMLPFCGYDMGDYFEHWLEMQNVIQDPPKLYLVNWFRQGADGKFLWPGFGENMRVLKWIVDRVSGKVGAHETIMGLVPHASDLELKGAAVTEATVAELTRIDAEGWKQEFELQQELFEKLQATTPKALLLQRELLMSRMS